MSELSTRLADIMRAESYGLDLEETVYGISVFAMDKSGRLYELGSVSASAILQDPAGAKQAIERIKFTPPNEHKEQ